MATVVSLLFGLAAAGRWETWLTWRNQVAFGQADPILGLEVGYYVFSLPDVAVRPRHGPGTGDRRGAGVAGALFRDRQPDVRLPLSRRRCAVPSRRHLALLGAAFFLLLAWGAWLSRAEHLLEPTPLIFGASYADVFARIPASALLAVASVIAAGLCVLHALSNRNWPVPAAVGLYLLVTIGTEVYAGALQRFVVTPNEQTRESPYIQHNIDATRRAFALDSVEERELSGDAALTQADIARNAATLENVRLWDHQPLLETFGQIQEIRTYYDFVSVDNDRYRVNGALRQVMLSARELNSASLPNRTWVNERLTFTHGYGLTLGPGEPGDARRPAGAVRARSAAGDQRGVHDRPAQPVFRRAVQRLRDRAAPTPGSSTTRGATTTSSPNTTARPACRWGRCGGRSSSPSGSAPTSWCSATTSAPRAGSCSTATSASASG